MGQFPGVGRPYAGWLYALYAGTAIAIFAARSATAIPVGGEITVTSNYIYRGISQTDRGPAAQIDLHASSNGTFVGIWASTRDNQHEPGGNYELEIYAGHRFNLTSAWSTTLSVVNYAYFQGSASIPADYQEFSASLAYLDRWNITVAAAPNVVRYRLGQRLGRYSGYVAEATGQWPLVGPVFLTGGAGYYYLSGGTLTWWMNRRSGIRGTGYAYGNLGLAVERGPWRLDAGYFLTQDRAQQLFSYPTSTHQFAATLSWRF